MKPSQLNLLKFIVWESIPMGYTSLAKSYDKIKDDLNLRNSIEDSMAAVNMVLAIEREFQIELPHSLDLGTFGELRLEVERLLTCNTAGQK